MKKYITVAALLAAGTAFAGADVTFVGSTEDGAEFTFESATSSATVVATLDVTALSNVMLAGSSLGKYTLIDLIDNDSNDIGLQTNYSSNGTSLISTSGIYGIWNQGGAYSIGMNSGSLGSESSSFWENETKASVVLTYSYETGTTGVLALGKNIDGAVSYYTYGGTWNTGLRGSTSVFDSVVFDSTIVSSADIYTGVVASAEAAKAMAVAAIPEPSAFGMLAGLGALALVASRRRRK